jgi:phosphoadenosine phosphosulfate reductase
VPADDALLDELSSIDRSFEHTDPHDAAVRALAWVDARFGSDAVFTCSFEDPVLAHLVSLHAPAAQVVVLDTQYLFAETWWYVEAMRRHLGLDVEIVRPDSAIVPDDRWAADVEGCCEVRKVEPLRRALDGRHAWITGIRRVDAPTRANAPTVSWDAARGLVKVNPLARWSDDDVARHITAHDLPVHPLTDRGYASIGCWPCTRPVAPGEDRRAGRWSGHDKTECGLHR